MRCLCHHRARAWTGTKTKKPLHRKFEWLFVLSLKRQFVRYVILFSGHVLTWYFENQWYFLGCFAWQELGGKHGKGTLRRDPFCALKFWRKQQAELARERTREFDLNMLKLLKRYFSSDGCSKRPWWCQRWENEHAGWIHDPAMVRVESCPTLKVNQKQKQKH